ESFDEGKFQEAAQGFAYVVERYPGAPFGRLAVLYRAHALARQGDQAAAATAYGEYLASAAVPDYLRQEALVGLARAKEAAGDTGRWSGSVTRDGGAGRRGRRLRFDSAPPSGVPRSAAARGAS